MAEKTDEPAAAAVAEPAQPEAKPDPPRFVGGKPRRCVVPLEYPMEYDGKLYSEIVIRRMSVEEVEAFVAAAAASEVGESAKPVLSLPVFDAPVALLVALDPDDQATLMDRAWDFLPRRLRQAAEQIPKDGAATSPSPPPSSAGAATS